MDDGTIRQDIGAVRHPQGQDEMTPYTIPPLTPTGCRGVTFRLCGSHEKAYGSPPPFPSMTSHNRGGQLPVGPARDASPDRVRPQMTMAPREDLPQTHRWHTGFWWWLGTTVLLLTRVFWFMATGQRLW
jgi:hypothetical protein